MIFHNYSRNARSYWPYFTLNYYPSTTGSNRAQMTQFYNDYSRPAQSNYDQAQLKYKISRMLD